jgi:type II secretory pathway pseudopilin PulG
MKAAEGGSALLDAIVALAILGGAGSALIAQLAMSLKSQEELRQREAAMVAADRVLASMALLNRSDLDLRLGRHRAGDKVIEVQRPDPTLYRISVAEARNPTLEALVTVVYRPDTTPR